MDPSPIPERSPTGGADEPPAPKPDPALPQLPECDVERTEDGLYLITHKTSGDSETADTEERAVIAGMVLRFGARQGGRR